MKEIAKTRPIYSSYVASPHNDESRLLSSAKRWEGRRAGGLVVFILMMATARQEGSSSLSLCIVPSWCVVVGMGMDGVVAKPDRHSTTILL